MLYAIIGKTFSEKEKIAENLKKQFNWSFINIYKEKTDDEYIKIKNGYINKKDIKEKDAILLDFPEDYKIIKEYTPITIIYVNTETKIEEMRYLISEKKQSLEEIQKQDKELLKPLEELKNTTRYKSILNNKTDCIYINNNDTEALNDNVIYLEKRKKCMENINKIIKQLMLDGKIQKEDEKVLITTPNDKKLAVEIELFSELIFEPNESHMSNIMFLFLSDADINIEKQQISTKYINEIDTIIKEPFFIKAIENTKDMDIEKMKKELTTSNELKEDIKDAIRKNISAYIYKKIQER